MEIREFKRQLVELQTIITDGIAYFSVWRGLMVEDDISAQAMNRYRGLFLPTRNALLSAALMQFAKVFDRDSRTVSFRNLLSAAQADRDTLVPFSSVESLSEITEKINTNANVLERLKNLRDQRLAHHDKDIVKNTTLLYGEIQKLVEEIKSIYNSLSTGHDRSSTYFENLVREAERHTSEVVRIMLEEKERSVHRIKKSEEETDSGKTMLR